MNAYYNDYSKKNTTYLPAEGVRRGTLGRTGAAIGRLIERLLCLIDALLGVLSSAKVLRVIRTSVSVICIFAVIGLVGGIERGLLGWGAGVLWALVIAAVEAVCIGKCR